MFFRHKGRERIEIKSATSEADNVTEHPAIKVSSTIETNVDNISNLLDNPDDLKIRRIKLGEKEIECAVAYMDGMIDPQSFQQSVMGSLEQAEKLPEDADAVFDFIYWKLLSISDVQKGTTFDEIVTPLLTGQTLIFIDGVQKAITVDTVGGDYRAIEEPNTETLIRGPRQGFVENLETNLAMVRRYLKDPNLRYKTYQVDRRGKHNVVLAYVEGIVHPEIVEEINRRMQTIDIDNIPESGYIEEWIEDSFLSPFPQFLNTERPDKVIATLLQGKAAIFVDGTPFVLVAPVVFANVLQSPEDYYQRWTIGSLLRVLRYIGAFLAIFLPALYIALVSFHPGMIPTKLVLSIASSREGVPFPPLIEAVLMVVTFEILQEAGARLPQTIGQTIGIVGGLVIGESAVQAGVVSPFMVIIIALTAVATFSIPSYSIAISFRIIRFGFMFAAGFLGLFGIILAYIMVNIHFVNLKSFGVPYSSPFAPFFAGDWGDVIIRQPIPTMSRRPKNVQTVDDVPIDLEGES